MKCSKVMKHQPERLLTTQTLHDAAERMKDANVGFLPICDAQEKVVGTLTDRDIVIRGVVNDLPPSTPVSEIMTGYVISCRPEDDLRYVENLMAEHRKSRIVCVDGTGRLVGVVSLSDVAHFENGGRASKTMRAVTSRETGEAHEDARMLRIADLMRDVWRHP